MSFTQHRTSIEQLIQNEYKKLPIAWQNAPFKKPADSPWIRVSVNNVTTTRVGISQIVERTVGLIQIQIFVPINNGAYDIGIIADDLAAILRSRKYNEITILDPNLTPGEETNGWFMSVLNTEFWATDFHPSRN